MVLATALFIEIGSVAVSALAVGRTCDIELCSLLYINNNHAQNGW